MLALYSNQLSGSIPPEIGNLTVLTGLYLWGNQLSGSILPEIGNLTALTVLSLSKNQLSGAIPSEIGNLTALTELSLWGNQLTGSIPPEIGNLTALTALSLRNNLLSGSIPPEIGNLTALTKLLLYSNQLSGALPVALTQLTKLVEFYFNETYLCVPPAGPIPEWLASINDVRSTGLVCGDGSTDTLTYIGSSHINGGSAFFQGEIDWRITLGDHVHLQLPFRNVGNAILTNAAVTITGALPTFGSVGTEIYNGSSWSSYQQPITLTPSTLTPGQTGIADFWIYVTNPDPSLLKSRPTGTWINVDDGNSDWRLSISLDQVAFDIAEHQDMLAGSCLHHPEDTQIQRYAQYAVGAHNKITPPSNGGDPDTAEQAISNLIRRVRSEFDYVDTEAARVEDVVLLAYTDGIGECRHFTDLAIGLLRSLGLPSRYTGASFGDILESAGHAWVEVYLGGACSNGWSPIDATWALSQGYQPFAPGIYEAALGRFLRGSADLYPLSNAQSMRSVPFLCTPTCYENVDCDKCKFASFNLSTSCVENIQPCYHNYSGSIISILASNEIEGISVNANTATFITRTMPFPAHIGISNLSSASIDVITTTISVFRDSDSTEPMYELDEPIRTITDLSPGSTVTVTWVVTPLISGTEIPFQVVAFSDEWANNYAQIQVINEPGLLPPLTIAGTCGGNNIMVGQTITFTASILDEMRQLINDTSVVVTATVYSTPTLGFSTSVTLPYCNDCGHYEQVIHLPYDAPVGRYIVEYSAGRNNYRSAQAISAFFATPPLTMTLTVAPLVLNMNDPMTLTVQVFDRGTTITQAGVYAEITTPGGVVPIPLFGDGEVYTATLRPADLVGNLDTPLLPGLWTIQAIGNYEGGLASATQSVMIRHSIYLPLVLRQS